MNRRKILALILVLPFAFAVGYRAGIEIKFDRDVIGRLERAANASTVETASQELSAALAKIETRGMTRGTTAIFYPTPGDDVGYWHRNLRAAQAGLDSLSTEASELEKSNMLIKLRETILERDDDDDVVIAPGGIAAFPDNRIVAALIAICGALAVCGVLIAVRGSWVRRKDIVIYLVTAAAAFLLTMFLNM